MRFLLIPVILLGAAVAGCTGPNSQSSGTVTFRDVHGLAVDPQNPVVLYVATHHGLYKGVNAKDWSKVGQETVDLMGFTMHPTAANVFYASGHPGKASPKDWAIGVVKSTDGGLSWTTMALKNEVDFHAMTISLASPSTVWGFYYRNQHFYESMDAGVTWTNFVPSTPAPQINSLASHATEARKVMAGTADGVWVSTDAGHQWSKLPGTQPPGAAGPLATSQGRPGLLWASFASTGLGKSSDGGLTWTQAGSVSFASNDGPSAIAIDPSRSETVYVASGRGAAYQSTDDGVSWTQIQQPGSA